MQCCLLLSVAALQFGTLLLVLEHALNVRQLLFHAVLVVMVTVVVVVAMVRLLLAGMVEGGAHRSKRSEHERVAVGGLFHAGNSGLSRVGGSGSGGWRLDDGLAIRRCGRCRAALGMRGDGLLLLALGWRGDSSLASSLLPSLSAALSMH